MLPGEYKFRIQKKEQEKESIEYLGRQKTLYPYNLCMGPDLPSYNLFLFLLFKV